MNIALQRLINSNDNQLYYVFTALSIFYLIGLALVFGLNAPYWHDERHFYETILYFGSRNIYDAIKDYTEVTPPLFFIFFTLIGKIAGFSLAFFRIINLIISFTAFQFLFLFLRNNTKKPVIALLISLLVMINPYVAGACFFLYTDMLAFMLFMFTLWSLFRKSEWLYLTGLTLTILTRQYYIFLPAAVIVCYLINWIRNKEFDDLRTLLFSILSVIPLLILMLIWGGSAPKSGIARWNPDNTLAFNFSYLTTYITMISVYALPFLVLGLYKLTGKMDVIIALILSCWYFVFPVQTSKIAIEQIGVYTVGFAHKLISRLAHNDFIEHTILYLLFLLSLTVLISIIRKLDLKSRTESMLFLILSAFFIIMPVSYQVWEKYLIPVIPVYCVLIYITANNKKIDSNKKPGVINLDLLEKAGA